ncbi:pseudouridine-5'-phosphate glycosidase [Deinococcus maricopensis]|uniref:Pseudouridine-5'-phosphate glycosidase n=1 Tax=Deinococcus maricopensis (strain DSM 21211 / LMG 22137 / NRRL B-23946 / LB-34) TaxID=709986 RepID=E8UBQ2_DEIML|nr:pseudouridine-5'-phosphate glycosidase [Deinococcus maricopensis]ADV68491.1 Pseudouridine-5'-phosphate glycosidase [Deinococcus maricopensis DSM 21211]
MTTTANPLVQYTPEVLDALQTGRPVVALESTIISHGMPYPQNVQTAREVEQVIRDAGAVPATIAVIAGELKAGLNDRELELLGTDKTVTKISTRDLPVTVATRAHGATTVATTMRLAHLAGIRVFATGGTGGVHRGASQTFDISADLTELARTAVTVVSAGVKSILDIPLTLEYLETQGVPVITLGAREFPAFYSRASGYASPLTLATPEEVARAMHAQQALGLPGGMLVANPIPEGAEIPASDINPHIEQALRDMDAQGVTGKDTTPYLLGRIVEITGGRSLEANIALVKNNARAAALIASAYASTRL